MHATSGAQASSSGGCFFRWAIRSHRRGALLERYRISCCGFDRPHLQAPGTLLREMKGRRVDKFEERTSSSSSRARAKSEGQTVGLTTRQGLPFSRGVLQDEHSLAPAKTRSSRPLGPSFLELFSGSGRLSSAVQCRGLRTVVPFDLTFGTEFNLLAHSTQRLIRDWIATGRVWFVHFGAPTVKGGKLEASLGCAKFTAEIIALCAQHGVLFSLENPSTSKLFHLDCIRNALRIARAVFVWCDLCRFGRPFRKTTVIASNCRELFSLGRRCRCRGTHPEQLRGRVRLDLGGGRPKWVWKTALAGAYPGELCHAWAKLLSRVAPSGAWGTTSPFSIRAGAMKLKKSLAGDHKNQRSGNVRGVMKCHGKTQSSSGGQSRRPAASIARERSQKVHDQSPGFLRRARLRKKMFTRVSGKHFSLFVRTAKGLVLDPLGSALLTSSIVL